MRTATVLVLAILALAGACDGGDGAGVEAGGPTTTGGDAGEELAFDVVAQGAMGPTEAGEVVAGSADELAAAWRARGGTEPPSTAGVDFDERSVVAVLAGQRSTAGFAIEVTSVDAGFTVHYTVTVPGESCLTAQVLTAPYQVVSIPKPPPEVEVSFEASEQTREC